VIAVSQSGETADTLAAVQASVGKAKVAAICNVLGSTLARKVPDTVFTHAGPEISVASTKAFTTQLIACLLFALKLGQVRGTVSPNTVKDIADSLSKLPHTIDEVLKQTSKAVQKIAKDFHNARDFLFLGRGLCFPIALEGALKLKEISYIHAEGYPAGEIKHGPLALIDESMPVVVIVQKSSIMEKTLSNLKEVESRGAKLIIITDAELSADAVGANSAIIHVPFIGETIAPVVLNLPLQLLAYYVAVQNGTDVDLPRNLAKSVTVE
jgi:glucosamine--fructose-6-phosphate aminotransferase (isomerizing)